MKKTCVFITGTNTVGKSTLARAIIKYFGGVCEEKSTKQITYCKDSRVCLAGSYPHDSKYGGVDGLSNTAILASVVEKGLSNADIIICEGSFLKTFGMNMTNAMFKAEQHLVVSIYADAKTLYNRIIGRTGINERRNWKKIVGNQKSAITSAKKWQQIGVKVLQIDAGSSTVEEKLNIVIKTIEKLCGSPLT